MNTHHPLTSRLSRLLLALAVLAGMVGGNAAQPVNAAGYAVACNDISALIAAVNSANSSGQADTINLGFACAYTLTGALPNGAGLPDITGNITIEGAGSTIARDPNAPAFRILHVAAGGSLTLNDLTISNGNHDSGGGIRNDGSLTVNRGIFLGNIGGGAGGAIFSGGSLNVDQSTFSRGAANNAGGIYLTGGTGTIQRTLFNNNAATNNDGGAVFVAGTAVVTIANSTFVYNHAVTLGGALVTVADPAANPQVNLVNDTLYGNSAGSGSSVYRYYGNVQVQNSIFAGGSGSTGHCVNVSSAGNNLSDDGTCGGGTGDQLNTNPQLGPLASNGGLTQSMALLPGSPAIGAGSSTACAAPPANAVDQRGFARPAGSCDTGAFQQGHVYGVTNTADGGAGSLRQAILDSNGSALAPGLPNLIYFNIAGTGVQTIQPASPLPAITQPALIDGYTQPGASPNTLTVGDDAHLIVQLDGTNAGLVQAANGLSIYASDTVVRGLAINRFYHAGILLSQQHNIIAGNFIGIDPSGTSAQPNGSDGIIVGNYGQPLPADGNIIGGPTPADRNVISGNGNNDPAGPRRGITLDQVIHTHIYGNYIGTNAAGTAAVGNSAMGIFVYRDGSNVIGGSAAGQGNLISGNPAGGIGVGDLVQSGGHVIKGNLIGTDAQGDPTLGNGQFGVSLDAPDVTVGGTGLGEGNTIAGNAGPGVVITGGAGNPVEGNSIYANSGLGVDLGGDGVTPNHAGGPIPGANDLQNYPVLGSAVSSGGSTTVTGQFNSAANNSYRLGFYAGAACSPTGYGQGQAYLGSSLTTTDGSGNAGLTATFPVNVQTGYWITAIATSVSSGDSSEFSACQLVTPNVIDLGNHTWTSAYTLALAPANNPVQQATVSEHLWYAGESNWFRFAVAPGQQVALSLTNLPANYDLTLYKDIGQAYVQIATQADLVQQSSRFAPDYIRPDYIRPDYIRPDYIRPDYIRPDYIRPDYIRPDYIRPDYIRPDYIRPDYIRPDYIRPDYIRSEAGIQAYSNAQDQALLTYSANDGTAPEYIVQNTFEETGYFYVRVTGRSGAFDLNTPFSLQVTDYNGVCAGIVPIQTAHTLQATGPGYKTIVLTDLGRMTGSDADKIALWNKLATFAARPEVAGAVVNVGAYAPLNKPGDATVIAANVQADDPNNVGCPYAKNLVGDAIKDIIDSYRGQNTGLEYVVIVGNDEVIPFFRHPEQVGMGQEKTYQPPVADNMPANAALQLSYVLSQEDYGASTYLSSLNRSLPVPDLAIGRLVETPAEASGMLDAYLSTQDGVVRTPASSLVTGYDFIAPDAATVAANFQTGTGVAAETLISPKGLSSTAPACANPYDPAQASSCAWTADNLASSLFGSRHDLVYFGGHFSQGSALAADYTTHLLTTALVAATVDMSNTIVFSMGCHSGYNTPDLEATPETIMPDWAQAFARKQATLLAGTGYQYGDTDTSQYGARLYDEVTRQLLLGSGPVAIGKALVAAKQNYLATTPILGGVDDKTMLQTTLYGLPMLSINLPHRLPPDGDPSIVSGTTLRGNGLSVADLNLNLGALTGHTKVLSSTVNLSDVTTTYYSGLNGTFVAPDVPVLPLEYHNVAVNTTVARGIGFRSGAYTDNANVIPLTGAPATELATSRGFFNSSTFFPTQMWRYNYVGALANGATGATHLMLTPAQFQSAGAASQSGTLRTYSTMGFRLYYSNNISAVALGGLPAILNVSATPGSGTVTFSVQVQGDPNAPVQDVWVTYTSLPGGPFYGSWQSLDLAPSATDPSVYQGTLSVTTPTGVLFVVQAANLSGLVTMDSNGGAYYPVTTATTPPPAPAGTALSLTATPASGGANYGSALGLSATLTDAAHNPLANQAVNFNLGSQTLVAVTDNTGTAGASMTLNQAPGAYTLSASFDATPAYLASSATAPLIVNPLSTTLTLVDPNPGEYTGPTPKVAVLADASGSKLVDQPVWFVVTGNGGPYTVFARTNGLGRAPLGLLLANGSYGITAYFSREVPPTGNAPVSPDPRYAGSTASGTFDINLAPLAPSVATVQVTQRGAFTATLPGVVNANGFAATVSVQLTTSSGNYTGPVTIAATPGTVSSTADTAVAANATGLAPATTYYYRVAATNSGGTRYGAEQSFTTLSAPVSTITLSPSAPDGSAGWYVHPVTVLVAATNATDVRCVLDPASPPASFDDIPAGCAFTGSGAGISADGQHVIWAAARDGYGQKELPHSQSFKIDATAPVITIAGVADNIVYTLGAVPAASCTATDATSGLNGTCTGTLSGGLANGAGTYTYTATAQDNAGNVATQTVHYRVIYRFDGFLQPINDTSYPATCGSPCTISIFKAGSTVPVKFQLKDASGNVVQANSLPVWLTPQQGSPTSSPVDESVYSDTTSAGNTYRWSSPQYIYNWGTPKTAAGYYWQIGVSLDDGQTYTVVVGLR